MPCSREDKLIHMGRMTFLMHSSSSCFTLVSCNLTWRASRTWLKALLAAPQSSQLEMSSMITRQLVLVIGSIRKWKRTLTKS